MKTRDLSIVVSTIVLLMLAAGVAGARPNQVLSSSTAAPVAQSAPSAADAAVASAIT